MAELIVEILLAILVYNIIGGIICVGWNAVKCPDGWEICNPYWSYQYHTSVNWFGAIMLSLLYSILCPIGAMCYWFYKLCTVGRK